MVAIFRVATLSEQWNVMENVERISIAECELLLYRAFLTSGISETAARSVSSALVAAEAEGQSGHGFSRAGDYIAQIRSGKINRNAIISSVKENDTAVRTNADNGLAYPALDESIAQGIQTAGQHGMALMSVFNSHHCGSLAYHVEKVADAGMIGLMMVNGPKAIAPWGSNVPVFGTNPIAFAAPRQDAPALVIDLSLSRVARGKVMHARKSGTSIPPDWALDASGQPTTDPQAALEGTMLPIGDAKGTSLALMVEILAAALTGSQFSHEASSFFTADGPPPAVGQFLIAIDPSRRHDGFLMRLESLLAHISALEGTRLPGERRLKARDDAHKNGLLVPAHYLTDIRAMLVT